MTRPTVAQLNDRVDKMDELLQALVRGLLATTAAAGAPELSAELDAVARARRRARLHLISGGKQ